MAGGSGNGSWLLNGGSKNLPILLMIYITLWEQYLPFWLSLLLLWLWGPFCPCELRPLQGVWSSASKKRSSERVRRMRKFSANMMTSSNGNIPRYWPFVRGIHRSPVNSPHKGQWRGALIFSLICAWTNGWVNNRDTGDLRHHRAHHEITVMTWSCNVDRRFSNRSI